VALGLAVKRSATSIRWSLVAACAIALIGPRATHAQLITIDRLADSLGKLRRTSTFAFRARIDSLRASTVPGISASAHTIAVTPTVSLQCPQAVGVYAGQPLTVFVEDTTRLAPLQEWWFFASGWVIGDHIGVRSVARFHAARADSALERDFLGPNGPRAQLAHHLEDTVFVVTGRISLDSVRPNVGTTIQRIINRGATAVSLPFTRGTVMRTPDGSHLDSTFNVAVPFSLVLTPLLQVPDAYQHLLFLLHVTLNEPGDLVTTGPKPPFMLRSADDILPIADSAGVSAVIATLPKGRLGAPPTDFVAQCGTLPP
jgi:hypothetical protein